MSLLDIVVIDGMLARDDCDHLKGVLILSVFESLPFVVRSNKREGMAKVSVRSDNNYGPNQSKNPLFIFVFSQGARLAPFLIT
jgi:hypothetical protein